MTADDRGDDLDARIEAECARTGHLPWDPDTDPEACACGEVPPLPAIASPPGDDGAWWREPAEPASTVEDMLAAWVTPPTGGADRG